MRKNVKLYVKSTVWTEGIVIVFCLLLIFIGGINIRLFQMCCVKGFWNWKVSDPLTVRLNMKKGAPLWIDRELRSASSSYSILLLIMIVTHNKKASVGLFEMYAVGTHQKD